MVSSKAETCIAPKIDVAAWEIISVHWFFFLNNERYFPLSEQEEKKRP